ncbi:MAG: hypothetical protein GOV00_03365 [Candidatus Altiarchaeota archaeon]|nr:hypothetical protein [Candidatus Altiarchaeota archaeon]
MIEVFFMIGALISLLSEKLSILFTVFSSLLLFSVWNFTLEFVITVVGLMSLIFSYSYLKGNPRRKLFYSLMYIFIFAMLLFVSARDWILLYVAWELMNWCSYFLIHFRESSAARHAARNALILNFIGSLALLGAILVYQSVNASLSFGILPELSLYLILLAALIKSAQFPFSFWLIDAMEAPTPASALLHSSTMVAAGAILVFKFQAQMITLAFLIKPLALLSFFVSALIAIKETNQKKIMAYSTISSVALMFYFFDSVFFLPIFTIHALVKAAMFFLIGTYASQQDYVLDLGLSKRSLTSILMIFAIASLAGFPPLGLFWIKAAAVDLILGSLMLFVTTIYFARFYFTVFSGGIQPREGVGTKLAIVSLLLSVLFTLPLVNLGVGVTAAIFIVLIPIAAMTYHWVLFKVVGHLLEKLLYLLTAFKLPTLLVNFDDRIYALGKKLLVVSEIVRTWFTGSFRNDVAYIAISLSILVLGVLLF